MKIERYLRNLGSNHLSRIKLRQAIFFGPLVIFSVLSFADIVKHDDYEKERDKIHNLYSGPMADITAILNETLKKCNRLPSEQEFKVFILNGSHPNIRCHEKIMIYGSTRGKGSFIEWTTGRDIPKLVQFLESKSYKVYSDTKKIHVILKPDTKNWYYKTIKHEDVEAIITCIKDESKCIATSIKSRIESCKMQNMFAKKYCYFGDKKVVDF